MTQVPPALEAWARRPGSRRVLAEARRRAERRSLGERGRLSVSLAPAERTDVGILLGVAWEAGANQPSIGLLRKRLGTYGVTLEELLVATGGPVEDRVADRERARDARSAEEHAAEQVLTSTLGAPLAAAVAARCLPAAGGGARLRRAEQLAALARECPGDAAPVPLAVLAARCFGDAHALDRTTPLGRAAARMAALLGGARAAVDAEDAGSGMPGAPLAQPAWGMDALTPTDPPGDGPAQPAWGMDAFTLTDPPGVSGAQPASGMDALTPTDPPGDGPVSAEAWRAAWASVGVACDRVSSTVLVLNLPLAGSPALEVATAAPGEPTWLTARALDGATELRPTAYPPVVFVCENPSILESAADRLGARSAPLVCTYGKPSMAALTLLRALSRSGARLCVRADNDVTGRAIVASVLAACPGAVTWRFDESSPTFEEQLVDDLVADLDAVADATPPAGCAGNARSAAP